MFDLATHRAERQETNSCSCEKPHPAASTNSQRFLPAGDPNCASSTVGREGFDTSDARD
ncbi:MAG: hypothetical protein GY717_09875 [Rhodobacteraceae bacterium]|nr:hypothetical protein [Paracoccaceae bacterium]